MSNYLKANISVFSFDFYRVMKKVVTCLR